MLVFIDFKPKPYALNLDNATVGLSLSPAGLLGRDALCINPKDFLIWVKGLGCRVQDLARVSGLGFRVLRVYGLEFRHPNMTVAVVP